MQRLWFTADTHFGHGRIIQYCNRPFKDFQHQDEEILRRFNEVIKPGDILYHLGDLSWSSYPLDKFFGRLNTKEVHLIWGNHDKEKRTVHPNIRSYSYIKNLHQGNHHAVLCHYAMRSWLGKGHGSFQLYGHSHGRLPGEGRQMDVGVDTHDFYPYSWEEIQNKLGKIEFKENEE